MNLVVHLSLAIAAIAISINGQTKALGDVPRHGVGTTACRAIPTSAYPPPTIVIANHSDFTKQHYPDRIREFRAAPLSCQDIVMLGDSLTERNDWAGALTTTIPVRNRGISGDTSDGVLSRLDEITIAEPKAVFLLIGTNDLWTKNTAGKTVANIMKIVRHIREHSPKTKIFVQTVFPVSAKLALNDKVRAINTALAARKSTFILLDSYSVLVDREGALNPSYTVDGVHLTASGYATWAKLINGRLAREGLSVAE